MCRHCSVYGIDVSKHQRKGDSNQAYPYDGRDVYAYIGARSVCGQWSLEDVEPKFNEDQIVSFEPAESIVEYNSERGSLKR